MKHLARVIYALATGRQTLEMDQLSPEEQLALAELQLPTRSCRGLAAALDKEVVPADWMEPLPMLPVRARP